MTLRISLSRPITGSSLCCRAISTRSEPYSSARVIRFLRVARWLARVAPRTAESLLSGTSSRRSPCGSDFFDGRSASTRCRVRICSPERYSFLICLARFSALQQGFRSPEKYKPLSLAARGQTRAESGDSAPSSAARKSICTPMPRTGSGSCGMSALRDLSGQRASICSSSHRMSMISPPQICRARFRRASTHRFLGETVRVHNQTSS